LVIATAIAIRDLRPGDWPEVSRIYAKGVATRNATFETEVPSWDEWDAAHQAGHRLVAVVEDEVVGWIRPRACFEARVLSRRCRGQRLRGRGGAGRASARLCSPR